MNTVDVVIGGGLDGAVLLPGAAAEDETMASLERLLLPLSGADADMDSGMLEVTGDDDTPGAADDATTELVGAATMAFTWGYVMPSRILFVTGQTVVYRDTSSVVTSLFVGQFVTSGAHEVTIEGQ